MHVCGEEPAIIGKLRGRGRKLLSSFIGANAPRRAVNGNPFFFLLLRWPMTLCCFINPPIRETTANGPLHPHPRDDFGSERNESPRSKGGEKEKKKEKEERKEKGEKKEGESIADCVVVRYREKNTPAPAPARARFSFYGNNFSQCNNPRGGFYLSAFIIVIRINVCDSFSTDCV
jgi:hypothetical protein